MGISHILLFGSIAATGAGVHVAAYFLEGVATLSTSANGVDRGAACLGLGDTIGRGSTEDTMVAIISVGAARTLALWPRGGGPTIRYEVGHGDLLVTSGSCQRTWEHAVPNAPAGRARISIQFRPAGVR